ncbi:hypothetical protein K474DRAFT_1591735 [Panus rudis PR-1116 ss-1]|nr:hypothetical protein K474DRAFT_1591735 [Panus rudis PR-1116 ss-1]
MINIYAGKLFDSEARQLVMNRVVTISPESGLIVDVQPYTLSDLQDVKFDGVNHIDLTSVTVLPGFVDAHVHFFLHPYSETSWEDQVTRESLAQRTIRATAHARRTLMAGFTTVRDLGTEGAEDADISLRACLSGRNPIIPGPRYFCANRAIVTTGSYGPKNRLYPSRDGVQGITGAEMADGVDECVKVVRRQVGAGADWIKVSLLQWPWTDYRFRANLADVSPLVAGKSIETFNAEELDAIVSTAHKLGVKVAAHTSGLSSWKELTGRHSNHQMDSVEHGQGAVDFKTSAEDDSNGSRTTWVPTLAAMYTLGQRNGAWDQAVKTFQAALSVKDRNVKIACGGDTGVFSHGENALELKLMFRLGADWKDVVQWATVGGWECVRSRHWEGKEGRERLAKVHKMADDIRVVGDNEMAFGIIRRGFSADIIATSGDLESNFEEAVDKESILFVMRSGRIYKQEGRDVW